MNDLVIKLTGEIVNSNFDEFYETATAIVKDADKELITDTDFAEAKVIIKSCEKAEKIIESAKKEAIKQTVDFDKLFSRMDELSNVMRSTRLSLNKKVAEEEKTRKDQIIQGGINSTSAVIQKSEGYDLVGKLFQINKDVFTLAIKGKRSLEKMQEAVDVGVTTETVRFDTLAKLAKENLSLIDTAEQDHIGLFPDKDSLLIKDSETVTALISSRIARKKAEETQRELDKTKAAERARKQAEDAIKENPPTILQEPLQAASHKEPEAKTKQGSTQYSKYFLTIEMYCNKETGIEMAKKVNEAISGSGAVIEINLTSE